MHEFILQTAVRHPVCALPDVLWVSNLFMDEIKVLFFLHEEEKISQRSLTCNLLFSEAANASTSFNFSYGLGRIPCKIIFLSYF